MNQPITVLLFDKDGNQLNNLVRWNASARTDDHGEYQFTDLLFLEASSRS